VSFFFRVKEEDMNMKGGRKESLSSQGRKHTKEGKSFDTTKGS